jgi:hypothetical protein
MMLEILYVIAIMGLILLMLKRPKRHKIVVLKNVRKGIMIP